MSSLSALAFGVKFGAHLQVRAVLGCVLGLFSEVSFPLNIVGAELFDEIGKAGHAALSVIVLILGVLCLLLGRSVGILSLTELRRTDQLQQARFLVSKNMCFFCAGRLLVGHTSAVGPDSTLLRSVLHGIVERIDLCLAELLCLLQSSVHTLGILGHTRLHRFLHRRSTILRGFGGNLLVALAVHRQWRDLLDLSLLRAAQVGGGLVFVAELDAHLLQLGHLLLHTHEVVVQAVRRGGILFLLGHHGFPLSRGDGVRLAITVLRIVSATFRGVEQIMRTIHFFYSSAQSCTKWVGVELPVHFLGILVRNDSIVLKVGSSLVHIAAHVVKCILSE
mmetsp:Transcript_41586/g.72129  ORF Transcript_41586/g.72129 Transcript_41586/m.72129 type:complete len:334 (+) Transcript_41586:2669-3670(+)